MYVVINTVHVEVFAIEIKIFDRQNHILFVPFQLLIVWLKGQTLVHFTLRFLPLRCHLGPWIDS